MSENIREEKGEWITIGLFILTVIAMLYFIDEVNHFLSFHTI